VARHLFIDYSNKRKIVTTTAYVHDCQIDLSKPGEVVYRDKGFSGIISKGLNAIILWSQEIS
jgi:IS5 family transposase